MRSSGRTLCLRAPRTLEPELPTLLRLLHPGTLVLRLGEQGRELPRAALVVYGDEHEIRAGDVDDLAGQRVLGLDTHADLHAGAADLIDRGRGGHEIAHDHRRDEGELVDAGRADLRARVALRRGARARVDELHDLAPVHVP